MPTRLRQSAAFFLVSPCRNATTIWLRDELREHGNPALAVADAGADTRQDSGRGAEVAPGESAGEGRGPDASPGATATATQDAPS